MSALQTAARPMMRRSALPLSAGRAAARRFESNAAGKAKEAASKASDSAQTYQAKAAQGLSRVSSSAGPAITGAARGVSSALGRVGGRTGKVIGFVERQVPSVLYYSKVSAELAKLVFRGQKMSPPSLQTFQTYWQNALQSLKNPSTLLQSASKTASQSSSAAQQVRSITPAQVATAGVLVAELLGFFTVGEIIGRFKLIGYHGGSANAHH